MPDGGSRFVKALLTNLGNLRQRAGLSESELEERLMLGPGWIRRFESAESIPSIDMILAILHETGGRFEDVLSGVPNVDASDVDRFIHAETDENGIIIRFRYASFDARYQLSEASVEDFVHVIKTLRDGLARLGTSAAPHSEAIKTDAVATTFLAAVRRWPHANPSDLWWFVVYRGYCDPFNHPGQFSRLDFTQSWKRTGGWALEEILVRHYAPFLKTKGVNLFIADGAEKQAIVASLEIEDRIEPDKIDVMLSGDTRKGPRFFGVVHVKASFAERRTDDVPLSIALSEAGYTSPLWTMDCKSTPGADPVNRGELGRIEGRRSAKRKDIEDEGYFTGCFSYNRLTAPSPNSLPHERRVYVCDFSNPDDPFSRFILRRWRTFRRR